MEDKDDLDKQSGRTKCPVNPKTKRAKCQGPIKDMSVFFTEICASSGG